MFLWRAFKNIIPTSANLKRHHVNTEGICLLCRDRWGSTEHSLLYCSKVVDIWKASRFWKVVKRAEGMELLDVAEAVFKEWGDVEYELWAGLLWQIWLYVCRLMHPDGERNEPPSEHLCVVM